MAVSNPNGELIQWSENEPYAGIPQTNNNNGQVTYWSNAEPDPNLFYIKSQDDFFFFF